MWPNPCETVVYAPSFPKPYAAQWRTSYFSQQQFFQCGIAPPDIPAPGRPHKSLQLPSPSLLTSGPPLYKSPRPLTPAPASRALVPHIYAVVIPDACTPTEPPAQAATTVTNTEPIAYLRARRFSRRNRAAFDIGHLWFKKIKMAEPSINTIYNNLQFLGRAVDDYVVK